MANRLLKSNVGRASIATSPIVFLALITPLIPVFKPYFTGYAGIVMLAAALVISITASRLPMVWAFGLLLLLTPLEPPIRISQSYVAGFGASVLTVSIFSLILVELVAKGTFRWKYLLDTPKPMLFLILLSMSVLLSGILAIFIFDIDLTMDEPIFILRLVKFGMIFSIGWYITVFYHSSMPRLLLTLIAGYSLSGLIGFTYSLDPPEFQEWMIVTFHKAYEYPIDNPYVMTALTQRSIGTTGNPNFYGGLMGAGLLISGLSFLFLRTSWRLTALLAGATMLILLNVLLTQSRSAFIGLGAAFLALVLLSAGFRVMQRKWLVWIDKSTILLLVILLIPTSIGLYKAVESSPRLSDTLNQSMTRVFATTAFRPAGEADFSPSVRAAQIREYTDKWLKYPITGYGFSEGFDDRNTATTNESEYTVILVRFGLIGAIFYAGLFLSIIFIGLQLFRSNNNTHRVLGIILVMIVVFNFGFAIGGPVLFEGRRMTILFAIAGLGYGALMHLRLARARSSEDPASQ